MSVPVLEVPTLGTGQTGLRKPLATLRSQRLGWPEPGEGGGVQKAPQEHWRCRAPRGWRQEGGPDRETDIPGPPEGFQVQRRPAYLQERPAARRTASASKGAPPGFRRTGDVRTRRGQSGRLPAEVLVAWREHGLRLRFCPLRGDVRCLFRPFRTVVESE